MGQIVIFIHLKPKTSTKNIIYVLKQILHKDLRNFTEILPKVFSKNFKNCLLDLVVSDLNYIVNIAYDYILYEVKNS